MTNRIIFRVWARRVLILSLVVAGWSALQGPQPWRWVGVVAMLVGTFSASLERRYRRQETARIAARMDEVEAEKRELGQAGDRYESALGSLPVGVMTIQDGRAVYANPLAQEVLGERVAQAEAPLPGVVRGVIQAAVSGVPSSAEFAQGLPRRVIQVSAVPVTDGLVLLHLFDVTERRQTDQMRQDFLIAASHELKTPVAAIKAAAETVLMELEDDQEMARRFSGRILDNAVRMSRIVSDLLDLSRLETASPPLEVCDLAEIMQEVVERFVSSGPRVDLQAAPTWVRGSRSYLALACGNLLENAVRHTPEEGWVWSEVTSENGEATVVVADNGSGIPSQELPRIFERFYRVDEGRSRSTGGTGLGLAIVKQVADLHDGRVEVESRLGRGSTFRLKLPVRRL